MTKSHDAVNHPAHYTSCPSGVECIEIAELLPFCLGNCYKYLHRAGLKGSYAEDLQKARFYAKRAFFNGEYMPSAVKKRMNYVASHRTDSVGNLLGVLKLWDADTDGKNSNAFLRALDDEIAQIDARALKTDVSELKKTAANAITSTFGLNSAMLSH